MDAENQYPLGGFPPFTSTVSSCPIEYSLETVTPDVTGKTLSRLTLDSASRLLTIFSQDSNQIGTYTVSVKGYITCLPSKFVLTDFTIEV